MNLVWIAFLFWSILINSGYTQFDFGIIHDFDLTTDVSYPSRDDDVTLSCRRTDRYNRKIAQNFIDRGEKISWELNDVSLFATSRNRKGDCIISKESGFLGRPNFSQNRNVRYPNASCKDDGTTLKLTIHEWRPNQVSGDIWRCVQFPFAESARLSLQSFVPVSGVSIKQVIEKGNNFKSPKGTIVTCRTSPCRPHAQIDWFVKSGDDDVMITSMANLQEQVDTGRNGLSVTTTAIFFTSDDDHDKEVFCTTSNRRDQVPVESQNISVIIKYPPSVSIRVIPGSSVVEGTDVRFQCTAFGRPQPEVKWTRKSKIENEDDTLVSLSPSVTLSSVRVSENAEYECTASNGLEPDAMDSVVLFVRERETVSSSDSSRVVDSQETSANDSDDGDDAGAIAGGIIAALIIIALIAVVAFLVIRHRRRKQKFVDNSSRQRALDDGDNQGIYSTCSTLPRTQSTPHYIEVLPPPNPDQKFSSNIANPQYGLEDNIIAGVRTSRNSNANRPLPNTPFDCDSGYEEIDDTNVSMISHSNSSKRREPRNSLTSETPESRECRYENEAGMRTDTAYSLANDGYEVPVSPRSMSQGNLPKWNNGSSQRNISNNGRITSTRNVGSTKKLAGQSSRKSDRRLYTNENDFDTQF